MGLGLGLGFNGGRDQRAAVREAEDALYQPLAVRSAADDAGAAVVVQRAGEHLARGGGAAVDPHLERRRPYHAALARVERLLRAWLGLGSGSGLGLRLRLGLR